MHVYKDNKQINTQKDVQYHQTLGKLKKKNYSENSLYTIQHGYTLKAKKKKNKKCLQRCRKVGPTNIDKAL